MKSKWAVFFILLAAIAAVLLWPGRSLPAASCQDIPATKCAVTNKVCFDMSQMVRDMCIKSGKYSELQCGVQAEDYYNDCMSANGCY